MGTPLTVVKGAACSGEFFFRMLILAATLNLPGIMIQPLGVVKSGSFEPQALDGSIFSTYFWFTFLSSGQGNWSMIWRIQTCTQ